MDDQNFLLWRAYFSKQEPLRSLSIISKINKIRISDCPAELINLVPILNEIRKKYPTRRTFLRWVYGDAVAKSLSYLRPPSTSKRAFVSHLVRKCSSRYPWMSSKFIHLAAFHPKILDEKDSHWGSLYERKEVSKGSAGRRILEIPNPPLRRIQKIILNDVLHHELKELPKYVMGCRDRQNKADLYRINPLAVAGNRYALSSPPLKHFFDIFHNASSHLHQHYVASFDIKDFFGSVRLSRHIIPTLVKMKTKTFMILPTTRKQDDTIKIEKKELVWEPDISLLIAKLVTHLGHLPQGAPTSPAIANLAFHAYDKKLINALGSDFIYTRYVDDITVSISKSMIKRYNLNSETEFKSYVSNIIENELNDSGFNINNAKTTCGRLDKGYKITGLLVETNHVRLPRRFKRKVRSLVYSLKSKGFINTAQSKYADVLQQTELIESRTKLRHVFREKNKRLSVEKLAVIMLRNLCPDLNITITPHREHTVADNMELKSDSGSYSKLDKKVKWNTLERLLTYLWTDEVSCKPNNGGLACFDSKGHILCHLSGGENIQFLLLSKSQAIACTALWHHISGIAAYLNIKDPNRCFEPIRKWRDEIIKIKSEIKIVPELIDNPPIKDPGGPIILTEAESVAELARNIYPYIKDHRFQLEETPISSKHLKWAKIFQSSAGNRDELKKWISSAAYLCISELQCLPQNQRPHSIDVFELIRVLNDRFQNFRSHGYSIEKRWIRNLRLSRDIDNILSINTNECQKAQKKLLEMLDNRFTTSTKGLQADGRKKWMEALTLNEWVESLEDRLNRASNEFIETHDKLTSDKSGEKIFKASTRDTLALSLSLLRNPIVGVSSQDIWKKLFDLGQFIIGITTESFDGRPSPKEEPSKFQNKRLEELKARIGEESYKFFSYSYMMRCRAAHAEDSSKLSEWRAIQYFVAGLLGKIKPRFKEKQLEVLFQPNDLQLTAYEGTEVKLRLIEGLNKGMGKLIL